MTNFASLILCLVGVVATSAWSLNERASFLSPISRTQRQKPRRLALLPNSKEDIQRMTILKHALELKCFRELCNHPRYKHLCLGPNPLQTKAPLPPSEARFLHFHKMTGKQFTDVTNNNRRLFPDGRVAFLNPNIYYINKRVNFPLSGNEPKFHLSPLITSSSKTTKEHPHQTEQTPLQSGEGRSAEQNVASGNKTVQIESNREGGDSNVVKTTTPTSKSQTTFRPYEVKEIIDEKPGDTYNNSFYFGGKQIIPGKEETKNTPEVQKTDVRNKTSPSKFVTNYGTMKNPQPPPVVLKTYNNSSNLTEKTKPPKSRKEHQKYLKLTLPPVFNTSIRVQKPTTLSKPTTNAAPTSKRTTTTTRQQHVELVYTPSVIPEANLNRSGFIKNLQERTTKKTSEPTETLSFWDLTHTTGSQEPTAREFVTVSTKEIIPGTSKPYSTTVTKGKPATLTTSDYQTVTSVVSGRDYPDDIKLDWDFAKDINTSPGAVFQTLEYFSEATINEADLTTTNFKEFTDQPLVFDLLTKLKSERKKEYESISKNSRKMHFGQKPQKNPASNDILFPYQPQQRRSDILITDSIDYFDYENTSLGLNYLEKLTHNNSVGVFNPLLNLTSNTIIPLIPVVINDLREGKIPPEDIPALSQAFGKYWAAVLTLNNTTDLDMLPVMKMKDDYDLETILKSLREEEHEAVTTEKVEDGFEYDFYDYIENYRELYKDNDQQGDQEAEENGLDVSANP